MNVHPFPVQSAQRKVVVAAATLSTLAALIVAAPDAHAQQPAPTDVGAATSHVSTVAPVSYTHLTLPTILLV